MSDPAQLYEADFFRWTQEQAALLRQVPSERINLPIDWEHAAEEIEDMGRRDFRSISSFIRVILEHLIKLTHSPAKDPRAGWRTTIARSRAEIDRILDDSPSLRRRLSERLLKDYALAREAALVSLVQDRVEPESVPLAPPYSIEQVIDHAWWPASRHGHTP